MIEVPKEDRSRAVMRTLVEVLAQGTSITAGLAHLYRFTHPSQAERNLETWRLEITDVVNEHDRIIREVDGRSPRVTISTNAVAVATWLANRSVDGLQSLMVFEDLQTTLPDIGKPDLEEACFELQHFGLVETSGAWGQPISSLNPTYALFWAFDPAVVKNDPLCDAQELARKLIEDESLGVIARLDEKIGWPRRRFNPALAYVMPLVRIKSNERQDRYPTSQLSVQSDDRFRLKRFIQQG